MGLQHLTQCPPEGVTDGTGTEEEEFSSRMWLSFNYSKPNSLMTVPLRSSKQENLDVCVLGAHRTLESSRVASMKLTHGEGPLKL